eukprot:bmy_12359T0
MDALEEESFALSISSASDAEFDAVVGYLEDIIMDDEFQLLQRNFMDKYYQEFEDTEENKLTYTPIFNEYISLVENNLSHPEYGWAFSSCIYGFVFWELWFCFCQEFGDKLTLFWERFEILGE